MKRLIPLALLLPAPSAASPSFSADDQADLRCVAALAIAAHEQQRGAPGWTDFPDLSLSAPRLAGLVTGRIGKAHGFRPEAVRAQALSAIKALQDASATATEPEAQAQDLTRTCLARLAPLDPPPAEPGMLRCAALSSIAYQDMLARDGQTNETTAMAVLASVLEGEARKELRASGRSNAESDTALGLERETIAQTQPEDTARVYRNGEELRLCMEMVKPPKGDAAPH